MQAGKAIGRALAGRAPQTVALAAAEREANAIPPGATVDPRAGLIRFQTTTVSLMMAASPPDGPDMRFRAAGLSDPTISVPRGARVTVHLINADSDTAHGWVLLSPAVDIGGVPHGPRAFAGSVAGLLGDPTSAGQAAETITFNASQPGTYAYICPVPGHAAMGMHGTFEVR
jgi:FtsP/CotA-like multicopper oxidase with cupredoxin domain